jgi:hypothetical protein
MLMEAQAFRWTEGSWYFILSGQKALKAVATFGYRPGMTRPLPLELRLT